MGKLISRLVWIPVGAALVVFLVANRHPVALSFDPISVNKPALTTWDMPLWVWLVLFLLIGFAMGSVGMWLSGRPGRIQAAADRRALKELRRENEILAARSTGEAPLIVAEN